MKRDELAPRERAEINSLVESSHEAMLETLRALRAEAAKRDRNSG
jgi:hypothetical protein